MHMYDMSKRTYRPYKLTYRPKNLRIGVPLRIDTHTQACFYECEPAAGLWRKHPKHLFDTQTTSDGKKQTVIGNETIHNAWQAT
jgi:hypothetical protein